MKTLTTKRKLIIGVLFVIGLLATLRAFGEPGEDMTEKVWMQNFIGSAIVGGAMFSAVAMLLKKWEDEQ